MPISLPEQLYTFQDLNRGFDPTAKLGYTFTQDFAVFRQFVLDGGAVPRSLDVREAQADHDAYIGDALRRFLDEQRKPLVGIMGGHSVLRTSVAYSDIARLARELTTRDYLVVTGGGPGVMEAAHLGAAFSASSDEILQKALGILAMAPKFPLLDDVIDNNGDIEPGKDGPLQDARDWLQRAREARDLAPPDMPVSLAIPTWLYGAEPTMPFATHYAKYFQNSIREEALVSNSRAGIIYGQGGGGTLREVFQDVEINFYAKSSEAFTPMIFFDAEGFWNQEATIDEVNKMVTRGGIRMDVAVPNILRAARFGRHEDKNAVQKCLDKICFTTDWNKIEDVLAKHAGAAKQNLMFALAAEPLMVTTSRINRR